MSSAVVGLSAMTSSGWLRDGHAMKHAMAHPARELMRYCASNAAASGSRGPQHGERPLAPTGPAPCHQRQMLINAVRWSLTGLSAVSGAAG